MAHRGLTQAKPLCRARGAPRLRNGLHQPQIAVTFRDASSLGEVGARILLEGLADRDPDRPLPEPAVLPTGFLPRPSCAPPPKR